MCPITDARKRRVFATIDELQERLVRAKEERRQKLEYDTVAATINALPARHVTERCVAEMIFVSMRIK